MDEYHRPTQACQEMQLSALSRDGSRERVSSRKFLAQKAGSAKVMQERAEVVKENTPVFRQIGDQVAETLAKPCAVTGKATQW